MPPGGASQGACDPSLKHTGRKKRRTASACDFQAHTSGLWVGTEITS